jgi:predicted nucleic acid-binding protein
LNYLVDTNVISEVRKSSRANRQVQDWWNSVQASSVYLHVLTIGEIQRGILQLQKTDRKQAKFLSAWLYGLSRLFSNRLVTLDLAAALVWAEIQLNRTLPHVDSVIAASAIRHDMTLVTRNVRDVRGTGVRCFNPFESVGENG